MAGLNAVQLAVCGEHLRLDEREVEQRNRSLMLKGLAVLGSQERVQALMEMWTLPEELSEIEERERQTAERIEAVKASPTGTAGKVEGFAERRKALLSSRGRADETTEEDEYADHTI